MKKVLAIDMGATSIRGIVGFIENDVLVTEEVMRFSHNIVNVNGRSRWEWDKIMNHIAETIYNLKDEIVSVGVDTWGVDYGLLDNSGELMENPIAYRDAQHELGYKKVNACIDQAELFKETGNQIMSINTLFQLMTYKLLEPEKFNNINTLLMMPDLINYHLTGQKFGERTICSTSQMYDLKNACWNTPLFQKLGLNANVLPPFVETGKVVGNTQNALLEKLRETSVSVISVASHDTASAVALTKAYGSPDTLFLSCGTWSLLGCCNDAPVVTEEVYANNLTNETGYNGKNMFLKNITGLYIMEKLVKAFDEQENRRYTYDEITEIVKNTPDFVGCIDVEDPVFAADTDTIITDIEAYLKKTGQKIPEDKTHYFKVIYESFVFNYKRVVESIEVALGKSFNSIQVIGGGSKSEVLCQMIADGLNMPVTAGPTEATAFGNILAQLSVFTEDTEALRSSIDKAYRIKNYIPKAVDKWTAAQEQFKTLTNK